MHAKECVLLSKSEHQCSASETNGLIGANLVAVARLLKHLIRDLEQQAAKRYLSVSDI